VSVNLPDYSGAPAWVLAVIGIQQGLWFVFAMYLLLMLIRTRAYVRERYGIPEQSCAGCEDCCCAFWCGCCATLQIARHTADCDAHSAACCTETGLSQPTGLSANAHEVV
jgi:hypothetical protein